MASKTAFSEAESAQSYLPPVFILNPRERVEPERVPIKSIILSDKDQKRHDNQIVPYPEKPLPKPIPKYPLEMICNPSTLYLALNEEPVTSRIWIWNSSSRSMYFIYCGLWGEMARVGASWSCSPRTRIWLPPGMRAEILVKATPREVAPIKCAICQMQIAAGHMRDNVTGNFSIPIHTNFLKYIPPPVYEVE